MFCSVLLLLSLFPSIYIFIFCLFIIMLLLHIPCVPTYFHFQYYSLLNKTNKTKITNVFNRLFLLVQTKKNLSVAYFFVLNDFVQQLPRYCPSRWQQYLRFFNNRIYLSSLSLWSVVTLFITVFQLYFIRRFCFPLTQIKMCILFKIRIYLFYFCFCFCFTILLCSGI